jgi:SAM-dependent methyltransferase
MAGEDHAAPADPPIEDGRTESLHRRLVRALALLTPWGLNRRINNVEGRIEARLAVAESRLDGVESAIRTLQDELAAARDGRLAGVEHRVDGMELAVSSVSDETARLRDRVVPAAVARADALLERLAEELEETGSLVERSLRGEPLPAPVAADGVNARIGNGLAEVQPLLLEAFRGSEEEIHHRMDLYLPDLRAALPVLDLGCGRGELLLLLREAGVKAAGIDGDPALAAAARRRGLDVVEGDVLEVLRTFADASQGAVTALHLFEHLPPSTLAAVLSEIRRVLRPGGLLIAECPNPHALRVGATLFWQDPTHSRPLLPETLTVFLGAAGFEITRIETLHPFPADQLLMDDEGGAGDLTSCSTPRAISRCGPRGPTLTKAHDDGG